MVLHAQRLWSLAVVASLLSVSIALPSRVSIAVEGSTLLVDGAPFFMKGVAYSPVPRGADVKQHWPFADYFIPEYEYIWNRDFPLLRAMGANTIRIYHWIPDQDHTLFLDIAHKHGLKVLITYDLRTTKTNPVVTAAQRQTIVNAFVEQVDRYKAHPALLMWIFGNELNGPWNGFLANMGQAFGCNADPHCMPARDGPAAADAAPCTPEGADEWATGVLVPCCAGLSVRNEAGKLICRAGPPAPPPGPPAPGCNSCWPHLFEWIDSALAAAKKADPARPITTALVDMGEDFLRDVVNASAPNLDVWGVNMYRGKTFGGFFEKVAAFSNKPAAALEFGVDAFRDSCGQLPSPCTSNDTNPGAGYGEDQNVHAEWNLALASALKGPANSIGGSMMAWSDEFWKSGHGTKGCWLGPQAAACPAVGAKCDDHAHCSCPNSDFNAHALCGYMLPSTFDQYVNEAWFGIVSVASSCRPAPSPHPDHFKGLDQLAPRKLFSDLAKFWKEGPSVPQPHFPTCAELLGGTPAPTGPPKPTPPPTPTANATPTPTNDSRPSPPPHNGTETPAPTKANSTATPTNASKPTPPPAPNPTPPTPPPKPTPPATPPPAPPPTVVPTTAPNETSTSMSVGEEVGLAFGMVAGSAVMFAFVFFVMSKLRAPDTAASAEQPSAAAGGDYTKMA